MAQGYWATAAAATGNVALFQRETEALVGLAKGSDWDFCEDLQSGDGKPNGGWQSGWEWNSCNHQTWSATAYLRMIHYGLFGMQFEPAGIRFAPTVPADWGPAILSNLFYRGSRLRIALRGKGTRVGEFRIDGKAPPNRCCRPSRRGSPGGDFARVIRVTIGLGATTDPTLIVK